MEIEPNNTSIPSHPNDKSLEAYKDWIRKLSSRFTTDKPEINLTQQEWIASWKEYWNQSLKRLEK